MAYLGKTPSQAVRSRYYFTASGGETSLAPAQVTGLSFTDANYVDVSLNGVALVSGTDYTATPSTNTISSLAALTASDVVEIVVYDTFSVFGGSVNGDFNISGGDLTLGDNDKAIFGAGSDLQIFHDGSTSFLSDQGTGNLKILAQNFIVSNPANTETMIAAVPDGAAELYYDSAKKLATASFGAQVTGSLAVDTITNATASTDVTIDTNFDIILDAGGGVGIGTSSLSAKAHIQTASSGSSVASSGDELFVEGSGDAGITIGAGNTSKASLFFADNGDSAAGRIRYDHSDNSMQFGTNGQAERMRIDSSGNLLVGKTAIGVDTNGFDVRPTGETGISVDSNIALDLNRTTNDGKIINLRKDDVTVGSIGTNGGRPFFKNPTYGGLKVGTGYSVDPANNSTGAGWDNALDLGAGGTRWKDLYLSGTAFLSGQSSISGNTASAGSLGITSGHASSPIRFYTGEYGNTATERMRIDSNGTVMTGKTVENTATDGIELNRSNVLVATRNNDAPLLLNRRSSDGDIALFRKDNTTVGSISVTASATAYNTSSDHRLKENVVDMTGATTRLKQLNPVRFNFIADADTTVDGFLAHEVQTVVPEAITGAHNEVDDDGNPVYQGIDQSKLVPLLVATIQELETRLTALENAE
jgi:hypothetical protein